MFLLTIMTMTGILISCTTAFDQIHSDSRLTRMEVIGIVKEWCAADAWMVSLMKRMIECRNLYMVR
jgi:hypothetical protein